MILWTFKEQRETEPEYPHLGTRAWRWVFEIRLWRATRIADWVASIGFDKQVQFGDGEWHDGVDGYYVNVAGPWQFGANYYYYDGHHSAYSFGFLSFEWHGAHCKKSVEE